MRARVIGGVLASFAAAALVLPGSAAAEPWGTSGADFDGVLCQIGQTQVPLGAWTVNGATPAYSTTDISGTNGSFGAAPVSGATTPLPDGASGISAQAAGAIAYLISTYGTGSPAELAEVSADVATLAGGGELQAQCLGQGGTNAGRAAARLERARKLAGPYTLAVTPPPATRPGRAAPLSVAVRSAAGTAVPGIEVAIKAGTQTLNAITDAAGVARTSISVPSAATTVTAQVTAPTSLYLVASDPASVTLAPPAPAAATATVQPVLHPHPAVSVEGAGLLLSGGTFTPVAHVSGTFGYTGTGTMRLTGPVRPPAGGCSSLGEAAFTGDPAWEGQFTFARDGDYRAGATPELKPGCYALGAAIETTDSTPHEKARAAYDANRTLLVSALELTSAAVSKIAPAGGLRAAITGTHAEGASVVSTLTARGPLPIGEKGCADADWKSAGVAGTSREVRSAVSGSNLRTTLELPRVRTVGCYALVPHSVVTLGGRSVVADGPLGAEGTVTAVLRPTISLAATAISGERGRPMTGTVQVNGTHGFGGVVEVGLTSGETLPITGCRDARFPADPAAAAPSGDTSRVTVAGDRQYAVTSPVATRNACYTLTARLVMSDNTTIDAVATPSADSSVFLAGVSAQASASSVVSRPAADTDVRAVIVYAVAVLLILVACAAVMIRAFRSESPEPTLYLLPEE